jgi:hypothetical protein
MGLAKCPLTESVVLTRILTSTAGNSAVATLCGTAACLTAVYLGSDYLVKSSTKAGMVLCRTVPGEDERCVEVTHKRFLDDYGYIKSDDDERNAELAWAAKQKRWDDKNFQTSILTIFPFSAVPTAARFYWRADTRRATEILEKYRREHPIPP